MNNFVTNFRAKLFPTLKRGLIFKIMSTISQTDEHIVERIEAAGAKIREIHDTTGQVIFGQDDVIRNTLITLLSGGHALLIGVPGIAKTSLVETLGAIMGLDNKRIQFTPDLMPYDITGSEVLEEDASGKRVFRFIKGPVFTQLLMADEINRASPKTQSALLQAMQEHQVSVAGQRQDIPHPFHVLATQNPLEQEGTYPLPEAQLDRFLMQIDMHYPDELAERRMLYATTGTEKVTLKTVLSANELIAMQNLVRQLPVGDMVVDAILELVRAALPGEGASEEINRLVAWGPGPRASQSFMMAVRARAMTDGRLAPSIEDVTALADPILKHRMALTFAARAEGIELADIIRDLAKRLE